MVARTFPPFCSLIKQGWRDKPQMIRQLKELFCKMKIFILFEKNDNEINFYATNKGVHKYYNLPKITELLKLLTTETL
jgi:hypothetical protein